MRRLTKTIEKKISKRQQYDGFLLYSA